MTTDDRGDHMRVLGVEEAVTWLNNYQNRDVYLHMEVNPHGYLRNAKVRLQSSHIHGDDDYRVYLTLSEPTGLVQLNGVTEICEDKGVLIFTAYDTQDRILETLIVSPSPLDM